MKKWLLLIVCACTLLPLSAQKKYTFLLTGASFAVPQNGWFEIGCEAFGAISLNKSVSGESIMHTSTRMFNGTFYSKEELEATDVFVIMHVHNADVANTSAIKEDYTQYVYTDINNNYATAYDYVIKKYKDDCYKLKDDPGSKYYGTENGKPALIVLCTHWHDARTVYNPSVRTLAQRWNLPLVKWDDNIGFTKNVLDEDGKQPSLKYCRDTETINGTTYGWHPLIGKNEYIQKKMAEIFIDELETFIDKVPLSVTAVAKNPVITQGEEARIAFYFTGDAPWNLEYEINGNTFSEENITDNPFIVKTAVPVNSSLTARPLKVSNSSETDGILEGNILVTYAQKTVNPYFDTHVHQNSNASVYTNSETLELKTSSDNYIREVFISFNLNEFTSDDNRIVLRLYIQDINYTGTVQGEPHLISVSGNTKTYTSLNWDNRPTDFTYISETWVEADEKGSYISMDISDWLKEQVQAGETQVTLRLKVAGAGRGLFRFPSIESTSENKPVILTSVKTEDTDEYWELVFRDDFNGTAVDQSQWYMYNGPGHGGNGLRRPSAFTVADGILTVTAQMADDQLVSGGMSHKLNMTYGKFEARVRADDDPSLATSAVLLTWPKSEQWPVDGENDFYETTTNRRNKFHTYIHYGADNKQYHKEHLFNAKEWLIVTMEWTADMIKIYVNGELQWTLTDTDAIPHVPHHLCIQLDGFKKIMTGSTRMQVDWVKIYQPAVASGIESQNTNKFIQISPNPVADYLNVKNIDNQSFRTVEIYSADGKIVKSEKIAMSKIDCHDLKSGIYFLRANTDSKSETVKFIKQ